MGSPIPNLSSAKAQRGSTLVEFASVGLLFFGLLLGVLEFGRLAFTWNLLVEGIRQSAQAAAVCPVGASEIRSSVLSTRGINIDIEYLDEDLNPVADPGGAGSLNVRFVRVGLTGYQHNLLIPRFATAFSPTMSTIRLRESLGLAPGENPDCG